MATIASLMITVDTTQLDDATKKLGSFTTAAQRAAVAANPMAAATQNAMASYQGLAVVSNQVSVSITNIAVAISNVTNVTAKAAAAVPNLTGGFKAISNAVGDIAKRTETLKGSAIPLYSTLKKLNDEVGEAGRLHQLGALSTAEHARAVWELGERQKEASKAQKIADEVYQNGGRHIRLTKDELGKLGGALKGIGKAFADNATPMQAISGALPALGETFVSAAMHGGTLKGALLSIGGELSEVAAVANPVGLAIAATAAVVAGGFAIAAQQLNRTGESADEVQKRLGLTDEQMKKAGNTSVTMGDVMNGVFKTAGEVIGETLGPAIDWIKDKVGGWYQATVDWTVGAISKVVGVWMGAFNVIGAVWKLLPAAIGDIAISSANALIEGVTKMINAVLAKANDMINFANKAAAAVHIDLKIPTFQPIALTKLKNDFEGASALVGKVGGEAFLKGLQFPKDLAGRTAANIYGARDKRVIDGAGPAAVPGGVSRNSGGGGAGDLSGGNANDDQVQKEIDDARAYADALKEQATTLGMSSIALKEYEIAQKAAAVATIDPQLAEAIKTQGAALITKMQAQAADTSAMDDHIAVMKLEKDMIGATQRERDIAIAGLEEEQKLRREGVTDPKLIADAVSKRKEEVGVADDLKAAQDGVNKSLATTKDTMAGVGQQGEKAAKGLADAFGDVGKALDSMLASLTNYAAKQDEIAKARADYVAKGGKDSAELAKYDQQAADAQKGYYRDIVTAAEGMVDKKSNAYQALMVAEKVYRAFEFAMSVKAAVQAAWESATKIAADQAGVTSHASSAAAHEALHTGEAVTGAAAGAGRMFGQLGVAAFPFVAAMVAVMASLGSGTAGGSIPGEHDAEDRQKTQGTGSVLGDSEAKSESIKKSLELVADHTNDMLEFYNPMLAALKSIDSQIGAMASVLARSLGVGGMLDTSKLGLGNSVSGPGGLMKLFVPLANLLPGLFSTKVTKTLQDQGLQFSAESLQAILSGGIQGQTYAQILTETKKSFLGLTYSDSLKKKTVNGALDPEFARQTTLLIGSLRDGVLSAASVLGIEGAAATLDAFKLDLGKISLKDLKGDEITQALEAVFGKAADGMASAVMPGLAAFQKVGEGAFETLTRLARDYQVVDVTLSSIGKVFGAVGVGSVEARERLVELSGGLDDFTDQAGFYAENFLSEAERLAPIQAAVSAELARLGLSGVKTRDQFKTLVQGLDVSTAEGAGLYAALMKLAPAFAAVTEESQALSDAKDALSGAYERESGALKDTHDRFADLAKSLHDFGTGLYSGPAAALSPEEQYRAAQAAFQQTAGLAAAGNEQALGELEGVSQAYLDASKAYFASSEGYFADLAAVRDAVSAAEASAGAQVDVAQAQLDAMTAQVGQLIELNAHVVTVAEAIAALQALMGGGATGAPVTPATAAQASNDNTAAVVTAIQDLQTEVEGVGDQLAADKVQRAAIAQQQDARLAALEEQLAAMRRAAQA